MPNINFEIPRKLHARAKAKAAAQEKGLYEFIIEAIQEKVKK